MTAAQLVEMGFSRREIGGMVRRGELHRMHRGVYAVGHVSPAAEARWAAGLLAAGSEAALSHTTALSVHGLWPPRHVTEVTAPTQRRGDERLRVHTAELRGDVTVVRGLRATTLPRTFLDLAAARWPIDKVVHEAAASGRCDLEALRHDALAAEGQPGAPALRGALALPHLRSQGERRLYAALRRAGLEPVMNAPIGRMTVDALLGDLVLELDHENTHGSAHAKQRDARRDAELTRRGFVVVRSREIEPLVRAARGADPSAPAPGARRTAPPPRRR